LTQANGSFISYEYDAAHRLVGVEDHLGNRIDYTLDAMGNILREEIRDPQDAITYHQQQVYNQLGQLQQQLDSEEHTTEYAYDADGNLSRITEARQNLTRHEHDMLGRLNQTIDALEAITQYGYDAQDNLSSVTDPLGRTTTYEYDGLGNLISQISPDRVPRRLPMTQQVIASVKPMPEASPRPTAMMF
jgi:YD repeat-containing protein